VIPVSRWQSWTPWLTSGLCLIAIMCWLEIRQMSNPIPRLEVNAQEVTIEAERDSNEFLGQTQSSGCQDCSGGQLVRNVGHGNRVNIRFWVPTAGPYRLRFRYFLAGDARACAVMVNNISVGRLGVPAMPSWNTPGWLNVAAQLEAGINSVGCDLPTAWSADFDVLIVDRMLTNTRALQPFVWDDQHRPLFVAVNVLPILGFVVFVGLGLLASLAVLWCALRSSAHHGTSRVVVWIAVALSVVLGAYLIDLLDSSLDMNSLYTRLRYLGIGLIALASVVLALRYSGQNKLLGGWLEPLIFVLAGTLTVLHLTDPWTHWVFARFYLDEHGQILWDEAFGYILSDSFGSLLLTTASGLMVTHLPRISGFYRRQLQLLLLSALSPHLIGYVIGVPLARLGLYPEIHYVTIGVALSAILLAIAVFKFQLLEHTPELWGRGVNLTSDLALVTDANGRFVEGNLEAYRTLQVTVGQPVTQILTDQTHLEIHERHFQVSRSAISGHNNLQGELIALHDVTSLKHTELKLRDANGELEELRDELRVHAVRDKLTGVFNRRHMDATLEGWLETVRESNQDLSIVLFDIDHFRQFNARWGHEGGDQVLRAIGMLLNARASDQFIPCRYGGEEFCVILPNTDLENARLIAEKLREDVRQLEVAFNGRGIAVTISASVASFKLHGEHMLRSDADAALRKAKVKGRNRVELPSKPKQTWGTGWG
jgi:diguanylate cyclase (GGDEF)-like protein